MRPTLQQVAKEAGVSQATVSRILRGMTERYHPDTVLRVEEAVRRLRYIPNTVARNLARRRTYMLALAFEYNPNFKRNYYFLETFSGIHQVTRREGYQVAILSSTREDRRDIIEYLGSGQYEGVLMIAPMRESPLVEWARDPACPVVSVGTTFPEEYRVPCVDVDNVRAAEEATRHLVELGHRRIGFVGGQPSHAASALRHEGYARAMRGAGIEPLPWLWAENENLGRVSGERSADRFFAAYPDATAIFCANDGVAVGTLKAASESGRRVPEDLSVIGFDDSPEAESARPPLTTMLQDAEEIGRTGALHLLERIEKGPPDDARSLLLPARLVLRSSTAAAPSP